MRLHPRARIVNAARNELARALADIWEKHELTVGEVVDICASVTANHTRYVLRQERHPNEPCKKADES